MLVTPLSASSLQVGRALKEIVTLVAQAALIVLVMLLPLDGGPGWMRALSNVNPLTYVVEAERALFASDLVNSDVLWGAVAAGLTALLGLTVGIRAMRGSAS